MSHSAAAVEPLLEAGAASGDDDDVPVYDEALGVFFEPYMSIVGMVVSCALVVVPVVASIALSVGVPASAPIVGCQNNLRDTDILKCIRGNDNVTTVTASLIFGVDTDSGNVHMDSIDGDSSSALGLVFAVNTISILFALEMYTISFYVDSLRAYRLLSYGVYTTDVKRGMLARLLGVIVFITVWAVVQVFVQVSVFRDLEGGPLEFMGASVAQGDNVTPVFDASYTALSSKNVFSHLIPVLLQYSALFSFMWARFNDILVGVSLKGVVRPRGVSRRDVLAGIARVKRKVPSGIAADAFHSHIYAQATGCSGVIWRLTRRCMCRCTQMVDFRLIRKEIGLSRADLDTIVKTLKNSGAFTELEEQQ